MKSNLHMSDEYSISRYAEVCAWISGIVIFILIISGKHTKAQENNQYNQDTIWLETGEMIPCLIIIDESNRSKISAFYCESEGIYKQDEYSLNKVQRFKKTSGEVNQKTLPVITADPEYVKVYLGMGGGWPSNGGFSFNVLFNNNLGGSISYKDFSLKSKNKPPDFEGGLSFLWGDPTDQLNLLSACFIKAFSGPGKLIRFSVEAGPALITYTEVKYFKGTGGFFSSNYSTKRVEQKGVGFTARGKLELPLAQFFGLEFAILLNINKYRSVVGFECYISLGRVRDRRKAS